MLDKCTEITEQKHWGSGDKQLV